MENHRPAQHDVDPQGVAPRLRSLAALVAALSVALVLLAGCTGSAAPSDHPRIDPSPSADGSAGTPADPSTDATAAAQGSSAPTAPGKPGYNLVFKDEFNGDRIDGSTWEKLTPWGTRFTMGESQYYDQANTFVKDGNLVIRSNDKPYKTWPYTSGILTSLNIPKLKYGYYEIRSKAPSGQGIWPAFWLTDDSTSEIDVFEMLGSEPRVLHSTIHHTVNGKWHQHKVETPGPDLSQDFHIFAVDWQPDHVTWYRDGLEVWRYTGDNIPAVPMWMVVNTAVGGRWSGKPDGTTQFPQEFLVDYIRVYEKL